MNQTQTKIGVRLYQRVISIYFSVPQGLDTTNKPIATVQQGALQTIHPLSN
jgi:hypothetical protein